MTPSCMCDAPPVVSPLSELDARYFCAFIELMDVRGFENGLGCDHQLFFAQAASKCFSKCPERFTLLEQHLIEIGLHEWERRGRSLERDRRS